jgi:hypothetical protein
MNNIIENATIIHKNGLKKIYDAISITEVGVYTGKIKINNENRDEFVNYGFIPIDQIQKILFLNEIGHLKKIKYRKNNKMEEIK